MDEARDRDRAQLPAGEAGSHGALASGEQQCWTARSISGADSASAELRFHSTRVQSGLSLFSTPNDAAVARAAGEKPSSRITFKHQGNWRSLGLFAPARIHEGIS